MLQTGLFTHRDCSQHEMGSWHPECPERLAAISGSPDLDRHRTASEAFRCAACVHSRRCSVRIASDYVARLQSSVPNDGLPAARSRHFDESAFAERGAARCRCGGRRGRPRGRRARSPTRFARSARRGTTRANPPRWGSAILNSIAIGARHAIEALGLQSVSRSSISMCIMAMEPRRFSRTTSGC